MNEEAVLHEVGQLKVHIARLSKWKDRDDNPTVTFGELFADDVVQNTFETLLGTLKAAKKRGVVKYGPQILLQGSHDAEVITLLANAPSGEHTEEAKKPPPPAIFGMPMPQKKKETTKYDDLEEDAPLQSFKKVTKGPQRSSRMSITLTDDDLKEEEKKVSKSTIETSEKEDDGPVTKAKPLPKVALPGLGQGMPVLKKTVPQEVKAKEEPKEEVVLKKTEAPKPVEKVEEKPEPPKPVERKIEIVRETPKPVTVEKKEEKPSYLPKPAPPISSGAGASKEDKIKKAAEKADREKEVQEERKRIAASEGEGGSGQRSIAKLKGAFESGTGVYTYSQLKLPNSKLTKDDIDFTKRETYMSDEEFLKVMGMSKAEFTKVPGWKQNDTKKKLGLY